MTDPQLATANWAVTALRSLTLQNVLILALLALIATPSYFSWKFLTDANFRHEFTSSARVISAGVPCEVVVGNLGRKEEQHTIFITYRVVGLNDYIVGVQADGSKLEHGEIETLCTEVHSEANILMQAREDRAELAREKERAHSGTAPTTKDH